MRYRRITKRINDKGRLYPETQNVQDLVDDVSDWYESAFLYNEEHYSTFKQSGTISGIVEDVVARRVWWDFDSKENPEAARQDAAELVNRLRKDGIHEDDLEIYFSGYKGVHVIVNLTKELTPDQVRVVAKSYVEKLPTFDNTVYNPSRIFRIPGTRHMTTGNYKFPITAATLLRTPIASIAEQAKSMANLSESDAEKFRWSSVDLTKTMNEAIASMNVKVQEKPKKETANALDFSKKPKFLSNCRWALQNGHFKEGNRSHALLCLGSTYKNLGFSQDHTYRMLKGTAELQASMTGAERFPDIELWNNIVTRVYAPSWNNGQYTCKKEGWLKDYCDSLGKHSCKHDSSERNSQPHTLVDVTDSFKDYVVNIEQNTIHTGIKSIDENVFISAGANVLILGAAGSGKTAISLNILANTSKAGIKTVFASLDMHRNRLYEKAMYKATGLNREQLYAAFKEGREAELVAKLKEEFGNVYFFNKSSPTVQDIRDYIHECEEQSGEKIKLVMVDYFERVTSEFSDETQASKKVAGDLQDMVNDLGVALITLVQPNKFGISGGPDTPLYEYTKIKGSSFMFQSARIILSLWRPFYTPQTREYDRYMQMAVLKNDLGELTEFAFNWHGPTGTISELEDFQYEELDQLLDKKAREKDGSKNDDSGY